MYKLILKKKCIKVTKNVIIIIPRNIFSKKLLLYLQTKKLPYPATDKITVHEANKKNIDSKIKFITKRYFLNNF